jgi:hypothetical protein
MRVSSSFDYFPLSHLPLRSKTAGVSTLYTARGRTVHGRSRRADRPLLGAAGCAGRIVHMIEQIAIRGPFAGSAKHERQRRHHEHAVVVEVHEQRPRDRFDPMGVISIPCEFRRLGHRRGAPRKIEFPEWMIRLRGRRVSRLARKLRLPIDGRRNPLFSGGAGLSSGAVGDRSSGLRLESFEAFGVPFSGSSWGGADGGEGGSQRSSRLCATSGPASNHTLAMRSQKITACSARTAAPINTY